MTVGKAIFSLLLGDADLRAIVDNRIFPEVAQQDAVLPYVVYNISSNEPSDTKREPSKMDTAQIEVNLYSESYTQCIDMATHVRAALDRVSGTYSGVNVQSIQYIGEVIDFDEAQRTYNITADYDVRISRSGFEIAQGSPITGVKLGALSDVDVTGVTDGQFIKYVAAQQEWQAADSAGGVTSLSALTDVNLTGLGSKDVINYNSTTGKWEPVDFLNVLYTNLKTGVSTTINDGANTNSALELGATTAKLKTGISEIVITETSPGDIDFIVATDGSGTTAYTALNIDGSDSANEAIFNIPVGTQLHIKSATHYAYLRYSGGANASLTLPTSSGTIARTADIAIDAAVAANTAKISYTDASAVAANTAKTGITSGQALAITANTAKVSYTDASAVAANTAKVGVIAGGTTGQALLKTSGTDYDTEWGNVTSGNLGNSNLTADNNRTFDNDGNSLTFDINSGDFEIKDSLNAKVYLTAGSGELQLRGLTFPAADGTTGQAITTNGAGALSFSDVSSGTSFDYARAIMSASVLNGGGSAQNFDSVTAQKVKFDTSADTEGTGITIDTSNNRITVDATGYYQLTANISFNSGGARTTPAAIFKKNGNTDLLGEGYGYIRAENNQNDNNNLVTCIVKLQANDYVEVFVGDSSNRSGSCFATQAFFEVSSAGGAAGPTGGQGPSGTTYDVVTLTGSTTLSSVHTTKYLVVNSASNCNLTVPASASYDANAEFVIEQRGAGVVTVLAASGVTVNTSETLVSGGQFAVMGLKRTASNVYTLTGERQSS